MMESRMKFTLCTLCLCKDRTLLDASQCSASGFKLQVVIEDLLQLKISKREHIPWMICSSCKGKLNDFRNFKSHAVRSVKFLKAMLLNYTFEDNLRTLRNAVEDGIGSDSEDDCMIIGEYEGHAQNPKTLPSSWNEFLEKLQGYPEVHGSCSESGDVYSEDDSCYSMPYRSGSEEDIRLYLESESDCEIIIGPGGQLEGYESSLSEHSDAQSVNGTYYLSGGMDVAWFYFVAKMFIIINCSS